MASRTPVIFGNWKLHKTIAEGLTLVTEIKNQVASIRDVEVGVAPVFTAISAIAKRLEGTKIQVAGQDCFYEDRGAWTGAVSPSLLKDAGCSHVIVGHSERRQHFNETNDGVGRKARAVLDAGLCPIICVGETEAERDAGATFERVDTQLAGAFATITAAEVGRIILAYEPVWAIGTGRTATPAQAQEVHGHIRDWLRQQFSEAAELVRIQYGGSVKPGNAAELMAQPDIDGALVGGASLAANDFVGIVKGARSAK